VGFAPYRPYPFFRKVGTVALSGSVAGRLTAVALDTLIEYQRNSVPIKQEKVLVRKGYQTGKLCERYVNRILREMVVA
jgi:hypothetical protein